MKEMPRTTIHKTLEQLLAGNSQIINLDILNLDITMTNSHRIGFPFLCMSLAAVIAASASGQENPPNALGFTMPSLAGQDVKLNDYLGDVVLYVNVASRCGLTPQYAKLQALHEKYSERGLHVLGFPCNQFGGQEPGTADEIQQFCSTEFGVEFPMFAKVDVNGEAACDLYKYLTSLEVGPAGKGKISWNFEKFLIGRDGQVVGRFSPKTAPDDAALIEAIESALAAEKPSS